MGKRKHLQRGDIGVVVLKDQGKEYSKEKELQAQGFKVGLSWRDGVYKLRDADKGQVTQSLGE